MLFGCTDHTQYPLIAARTIPQSPLTVQTPQPQIVVDLPLAAANATLLDLRHDPIAQRLYVTDTAGNLFVIDAERYKIVATLRALGGELTLDTTHQRLYAAPGSTYFQEAGQSVITVIDMVNNTIIGLLPGRHIAVDERRNRLFIGEAIARYPAAAGAPNPPGIRILDGHTLTPLRELPQAGVPFYNRLRDELLIMAHTVYTVDPARPTETTDLFPELAAQALPWCNGCTWADALYLFPEANLIAIDVRPHCMSGYAMVRPPAFFDATTLEPLSDLADLPELQGGCGSKRMLLPPIMGQIYRTYALYRYVSFTNLMIYDDTGAAIGWRDGILPRFINPQTAQAYLAGGTVLDLATLNPVGQWPEGCIFTYNEAKGLLYARGPAGVLRVIDQQGGALATKEAPLAMSPTGQAIVGIFPSPEYLRDQTLLLLLEQGLLLRSTDGGQQWYQLRGGLPAAEPLTLQVVFSPYYALDRTIFAAGYRNEGQGVGVLRSSDGGNTWQPLWQGLMHLRITDLQLSPRFGSDQTIWVKANYHQVVSGNVGQSWQRSTDNGVTWSLVATGTSELDLAQALTDLPDFPERTAFTLPVRIREGDHGLAYSPDHGERWLPIALPLANDEWVLTLLPAPTYAIDNAADGVIYALSDYHLWRTSDNGRNWSQWQVPIKQPRTYANALRVLEISPLLANGRYQLFIGTNDGQFLALYPDEQNWLPIPLN